MPQGDHYWIMKTAVQWVDESPQTRDVSVEVSPFTREVLFLFSIKGRDNWYHNEEAAFRFLREWHQKRLGLTSDAIAVDPIPR